MQVLKSRIWILGLVCFLSCIQGAAFSQIVVEKEQVLVLPDEIASGLLGIRAVDDSVFIASENGKYIKYEISTGERLNGVMPVKKVTDFDVILGQVIYLDTTGRLGGKIRPEWPTRFSAARIESTNEGVLLTGAQKSFFLEKNATGAVELSGSFIMKPVNNGFIWRLEVLAKTGRWAIVLYDCYGNLLKEIYEFSSDFNPTGLEIGPVGFEGEVLISFHNGSQRELALIGQNGHMVWRLNASPKLALRDVAFDSKGKLLVLEKEGKEVVLNRWNFKIPQG